MTDSKPSGRGGPNRGQGRNVSDEPKAKLLNIRLTAEEYQRLSDYAQNAHSDMSKIVRHRIADILNGSIN